MKKLFIITLIFVSAIGMSFSQDTLTTADEKLK